MTELIPIILIDGRPVRRHRFIKSLEIAPEFVVINALPALELFEAAQTETPAALVVVDGTFTDTAFYTTFVEKARHLKCGVVPIWDYPTPEADQQRHDLLEGQFNIDASETRVDPRLILFVETLRAALHQTNQAERPTALDLAETTSRALAAPIAIPQPKKVPRPASHARAAFPSPDTIIGIGASTGGVQALSKVLSFWQHDAPPTLIVQHMPADFVAGFADRLNRLSKAHVQVAKDGDALVAGCVYVAPGDERHMYVERAGHLIVRLKAGAPVAGHTPSVDALFTSMTSLGSAARCALLTGMGADGAEGLASVRAAGGSTVAQDEASCTVFGMPKEAIERNGADIVLPLDRIGPWLVQSSYRAAV